MPAPNLDAITQAITNATTVEVGAAMLIQGLADQIRALEPTQQAINALADKVQADAQTLAEAITANTNP